MQHLLCNSCLLSSSTLQHTLLNKQHPFVGPYMSIQQYSNVGPKRLDNTQQLTNKRRSTTPLQRTSPRNKKTRNVPRKGIAAQPRTKIPIRARSARTPLGTLLSGATERTSQAMFSGFPLHWVRPSSLLEHNQRPKWLPRYALSKAPLCTWEAPNKVCSRGSRVFATAEMYVTRLLNGYRPWSLPSLWFRALSPT